MSHTVTFSHSLRRALSSRLLVMTTLPALDGTMFALAARGLFASPTGAAFAGLTVIAGASAWLAARDEFGPRATRADRAALALVALASTLAAALSAWAGAALGARVELAWFPVAAGVAVIALGLELLGARLPRVGAVPLPALLVGAGAVAEVLRWTL